MTIDVAALAALEIRDMRFAYSERDTMFYALSVGMGADPLDAAELPFVYEGAGLRAVPTMAVVLASTGIIRKTGVDFSKVLHGEQRLTLHRPLPVSGELLATSHVSAVCNKGESKGAVLLLETSARSADDGKPLFTFFMTIIARGDGGFGGPQGAGPEPHSIPDRPADVVVVLRKAFGFGACAMGGWGGEQSLIVAWPTADFASLPVSGGVAAAFKSEIEQAADPDAARREIEARFKDGTDPFNAAARFTVHDVIKPDETRRRIMHAFELSRSRRSQSPEPTPRYGVMP